MELTICSREHAESALRGPHPFTHIISIGDSLRQSPVEGWKTVPHRLALFFDDITKHSPAYPHLKPPSIEVVRKIINFAKKMPEDANLLVHCEMGISRSTAAATIVLTTLAGPGSEDACLEKVCMAREIARPNETMIEIADYLLKRDGRLNAALETARMMRICLPYGSGY